MTISRAQMNRQLYDLGGAVDQARDFYTNNLGMNPQEANAVLSDAMSSLNQQTQPQSMMQMASNGGRIGYQMGGITSMPMNFGQPLQVSQPMMNSSFGSMQPMMNNPMSNYGQTPLTMAGGGITRLGYQEGGVTLPSQGSELSQMQQMDPEQSLQTIIKILIENGIPPEQAQQLALQIIQIFAQGGEPAVEQFANQLEQQEQMETMAGGGIAGYGYRQGYFVGGIAKAVGSVFKGAAKAVSGVVKGVASAVKSVVKSDIGKLALLAGGAYLMMNPAMFAGGLSTSSLAGTSLAIPATQTAALSSAGLGGLGASLVAPEVAALGSFAAPTAASAGAGITAANLANTSLAIPSATSITSSAATTPSFFQSIGQGVRDFAANPIGKLGEYGSQALQYAKDNKLTTALTVANLASLGANLGIPRNEGEDDMSYEKRLKEAQGYVTQYGRNLQITNPEFYAREGAVNPFAQTAANGGIMGYAKGGSMIPPARQIEGGIIELDARKTGGYIPYGKKERVDDVPAMLAKDEFVFTSRAVKAAGGGSARQGAAKMYKLMKQLESKGRKMERGARA